MTRSAGPSPSPVVQQIIEDFAAKQGVERREISDQEIVERTLYTMVNEGAKILEEGMAQRASDIDVVWVYGYGWPVYRGGPMFWADTEGLGQDRRGPEAPGRADGQRFQLLQAAARQGGKGREVHPLRRVFREVSGGRAMSDYMVEKSTGPTAVRYKDRRCGSTGSPRMLVVTQVYIGFTFADMPRGPERAVLFAWHKTLGAMILILALVRLAVRLINPPPPYPCELSPSGSGSWRCGTTASSMSC